VDGVILSITIPTNTDAMVSFDPLIEKGRCVKLMCDDKVIWMRGKMNDELELLQGMSDLSEDPFTGTMSIRIISGTYTFTAYWQ
jgi:hypothetical protein